MKRPLMWASLGTFAGSLAMLFGTRAVVGAVIALSLVAAAILLSFRRIPLSSMVIPTSVLLGTVMCMLFLRAERTCSEALFAMQRIPCTVTDVSENSFTAVPRLEGYSRFRILVFVRETAPQIGDAVIVSGPVTDFPSPENEGEWDSSAYYRAVGYIGRASSYEPAGKTKMTLRLTIAKLRARLSEQIDRLYPNQTAAMVKAVLYCEKSELDEEVSQRYRNLGIAHILAVSGLHITVFGGFLAWLFRSFLRRPLAETAAAFVLLGYGALTGFPISCARAIIMFLLYAIGRALGRTPDRITNVTVTMALFVLCRPVIVLQQGFVLSFGCAYIILWMSAENEAKKLKEGEQKDRNEGKFKRFTDAFRYGVKLQFLLLPIQVSLFYMTSPYAPLLNLCVIPMMGILLPGAAASLGASLIIFAVGRFLAGFSYYGFSIIDISSKLVRVLPYSVIVTGKPKVLNYVMYFALAGIIFRMRKKHVRIATVLAMLVFLCFLPIRTKDMRICNLSVGQGDCCVIMRGGACIVIDCGSSSKKTVGSKILVPFLHYHGFDKPDLIVVSHIDEDHVNGIEELLKGDWGDVATLLPCTETAEEYRALSNVRFIGTGDSVRVRCGLLSGDSIKVEALHPSLGTTDSDDYYVSDNDRNDNSLVVTVSDGQYLALFTGDCGSEPLAKIASVYEAMLQQCDYLKVAHHGSVHSAEETFYETIRPAVATISVGVNSYGHPSPVVITMAEKAGAHVYTTLDCGQITTRFGRDGISVSVFLDDE